jgi:drug/metabolite transporter (DMT)-like permease
MPAPSQSRLAYAFLVFTALFWGGNAVAGKLAVGHISPMTLTAVRWTMAFFIILAIGYPHVRKEWVQLRRYLPLLFAYGMTGFAAFNIALYSALNHTSAINVTIEQSGMPMFIFLANFLLFRTGVTAAQIVGFVLSLIGVAVTASNGDLTRLAELDINRGDAIMLLAILFYGGYTVALRYKPNLSWQTLMTVMSFSAMLTALPFAWWEQTYGGGFMPDEKGFAIAAYTAIFPALLAQVYYIRGVELIGSNRAGLFINLVPVFGTLLAIAILGEQFHAYHAIALVLVISGIWMSERKAEKQKSGR